MIRKIIFSSIFVLLLFSISLYLFGVRRVELGSTFLSFMKNCSRELENFKISIPNIPSIPLMDEVNGILIVVDLLTKFFNGLINVINFIILILNTVIQVLQFLFILLKNFISSRDVLISQA